MARKMSDASHSRSWTVNTAYQEHSLCNCQLPASIIGCYSARNWSKRQKVLVSPSNAALIRLSSTSVRIG